ncbi:MAG: sigma 54-interacting transcriptional regulator [Clostridiales Family XIII bacterium]|jgi:PAS domain S-box-containing protein|nr:sigma 54-interacting transcriptional regulator [Clostridiales Family XIII bacterium]
MDSERYYQAIGAINRRIGEFREMAEALGLPFPFTGGAVAGGGGLGGSAAGAVAAGAGGLAEPGEGTGADAEIEMALGGVDSIARFAVSLAKIFLESPDSIYVSDASGTTRMVSKCFEKATGVASQDVLGRNVAELESAGFFRPSVHRLVFEEGRQVSVMQTGRNGKKNLVTGAPIYGSDGKIEMCVSSARTMEEIERVYSYYYGEGTGGESGKSPGAPARIMADSAAMKRIVDVIARIKDTDSTILISGESGVGKSMLAKYIHACSNRAGGPIVEINCGTIPEHLLESELFGYNSGAFTGASSAGKQGLVEMAAGGTLLLDEISELPAPLQVKLLNLIQDKQIMRIGAKKPTKVDTRIIAASNNDLKALVKAGRFRADLYYRLNVIPIHIPPLRERRDDIVPAVLFFARRFQEKYKKTVICSDAFLDEMRRRDWAGNVRELENTVERMVIMSRDGVLSSSVINIGEEDAGQAADEMAPDGDMEFSALKSAMESLERRVVCTAYEKLGSSYKVAEALGISQTSAYRKIKKYTGQAAAE